jgi:hypothetical protein
LKFPVQVSDSIAPKNQEMDSARQLVSPRVPLTLSWRQFVVTPGSFHVSQGYFSIQVVAGIDLEIPTA